MTVGVHWAAFVPAALVVSLVPGANQLLSLRNAVRQGTVDATVALLGRLAAFLVLLAAVVVGLGAVLTTSATAFAVVTWIGVAYLAWLGLAALRAAWRGQGVDAANPPGALRSRGALARQEFLVAMTNPKALLLFAAFLPQFVSTTGPAAPQIAVLGLAYIGIEAVSALAYTALGGRLGRSGLTTTVRRRFDAICGTAFLGLAGALALGQRP